MYKSSFHEGNCSLCGSKEEVMTLGFPDTNIKDKDYCVKCLRNYQFKINHYVEKVGDYFKTYIDIKDLLFYYNIDDLIRCLSSYTITEDYFVILVNQYLDKRNFSLNVTFSHDVLLRLSRIYKENYFIMSPLLYYNYQKVRNKVRKYSGVSCSRKISITDYIKLKDTLDEFYPEIKED